MPPAHGLDVLLAHERPGGNFGRASDLEGGGIDQARRIRTGVTGRKGEQSDARWDTGLVGDEVLVSVGSGATEDRRPRQASGCWSGSGASSRRVVHQPSHWTRVVASIALVGLVAGGLVMSIRERGGRAVRDDGSDERTQAGTAHVAYSEAVRRFGQAGSFSYRGRVHAAGPSAMRPGTWLARDVTVEGAVLLPDAITREVAVAASGGAVETVTSGQTAWSRTATSAPGLAHAAWEVVVSPDTTGPSPPGAFDGPRPDRLGIALLADVVRSAGNPRGEPPDAAGRRTLHAASPMNARDLLYGDLMAGAEVSLVLDEAGDVDQIIVASAPVDDPQLVVEVAIERLEEPELITPAQIGGPARGAVPADVFEGRGCRSPRAGPGARGLGTDTRKQRSTGPWGYRTSAPGSAWITATWRRYLIGGCHWASRQTDVAAGWAAVASPGASRSAPGRSRPSSGGLGVDDGDGVRRRDDGQLQHRPVGRRHGGRAGIAGVVRCGDQAGIHRRLPVVAVTGTCPLEWSSSEQCDHRPTG